MNINIIICQRSPVALDYYRDRPARGSLTLLQYLPPSRFLNHLMVTVLLQRIIVISIDMYIRVCRTACPVLVTCQQSITSLCIVFTHGAIKQQVRGAFYG